MMYREELLQSDVRRNLWDVVKQKPGIHFRALGRAAEVSSAGQLRHHVDQLVRNRVLIEVEDGRYRRYFAVGDHHPQVRRTLARFARPVPRRIGRILLGGPMNRTELRRRLGCADSTLGYHLSRMLEHGDLVKERDGNACRYSLADPESVRTVILVHDSAVGDHAAGQVNLDHTSHVDDGQAAASA